MSSPRDLTLIANLHHQMHDIAQPLASLQCRLEIGKLMGDGTSLAEAVEGGLEDVFRLIAAFSRMRDVLNSCKEGQD